jgi:NAD(P)H-dependent FMN reductase
MNYVPKILAFAGSARHGSYNKKFLKIAAAAAEAAGAEVTIVDLKDLPLPLYNADLEEKEGLSQNVRTLKELFLKHDALMIASPEYNSSITPLLKNTIDWVSRSLPGEAPLACFKDKVVCLMSASPGALGGLRALAHVRDILGNIGCIVLPQQQALPKAGEAFAEDGSLKDQKIQAAIEKLAGNLVGFLRKWKG